MKFSLKQNEISQQGFTPRISRPGITFPNRGGARMDDKFHRKYFFGEIIIDQSKNTRFFGWMSDLWSYKKC